MARRVKHRSGRFKRSAGMLGWVLGPVAYGAIRQKVSDRIAPLTSKIPLGNLSDEAGMLGLAYVAKKFVGKKIPLVSDVANAAMVIELARIGEAVANGQVSLGALSSSSSTSSGTVVGV